VDGKLEYTHAGGPVTFHAVVHDDGSFADFVLNSEIHAVQSLQGAVTGNSIAGTCWNPYCESRLALTKARARVDQ
jgi:hypothetical protein